MARRALILVLAAVLAGCATRPGPVPDVNSDVEIAYGRPDMVPAGYCEGWHTRPQVVRVKPARQANVQRRVVAHELWHAAGYGWHQSSPACYSYAIASTAPCGPLGPEEAAAIRRVRGSFLLHVEDEALRPDVDWSAALWNAAAGRALFEVAP